MVLACACAEVSEGNRTPTGVFVVYARQLCRQWNWQVVRLFQTTEDQVISAMSRPVTGIVLLEISNDTAKACRTHPKSAPLAARLGADDLDGALGISGGLEGRWNPTLRPCPARHSDDRCSGALGTLQELHAFKYALLVILFFINVEYRIEHDAVALPISMMIKSALSCNAQTQARLFQFSQFRP